MDGKDYRGRFTAGNDYAAKGGRARTRSLTPAQRSAIARQGWLAMVAKWFDGDALAARAWFTAKGQAANDRHYPPEMQVFEDPGPMPGGGEE